MSKPCSICTSQRCGAIDKAVVLGEPIRTIAHREGISRYALMRHIKGGHVAATIAKAKDAKEVTRANTILQQVDDLKKEFKDLMKIAKEDGDRDSFIKAGREVFRAIELLAKVAGELNGDGVQVTNQILIQESNQLTQIFMEALRSEIDPESCQRVISYLEKRRAALPGPASG